MQTKNNSISALKLLEFLTALLLILEMNSIFFKLRSIDLRISEIASFMIIALYVLANRKTKKKDIQTVVSYEIYATFFALMSVRGTNIVSYTVKFLVIIPILILLYRSNFLIGVEVVKIMSEITVFLALSSLIMYILSYQIPSFGTVSIEWGSLKEAENYIFFFKCQKQSIFGRQILRNTGIFCEAPMYGFCLAMALCTQLFFFRKISKKKIALLCLTIISTISMTAILLMAGMLVMKYYYGNDVGLAQRNDVVPSGKRKRALKYVFTLIGITVFVFVFSYFYNFKLNTGLSYAKRMDDYVAAYHAWQQRPIWGIGYGMGDQIVNYMVEWRIKYSTTGYSNAVMFILSTMGVYGSLLYIFGPVRGIACNFQKRKYLSLQFIVLVILLFVTIVPTQLLVLNYVALGISSKKPTVDLCKELSKEN